jgi:cytochrome P450
MTSPAIELTPNVLLDPEVIDRPYDLYHQLLEEAPVWRVPGTDIVLVSSFDAVTEATTRTADFSSNLVALLYRKDDGTPGVQPFESGVQALATADPPMHSVHRGAVFPELVARRMATLREEIQDLTTHHLDAALRQPTFEAMAAIANAIPIRVVSKLIGFQDEDPDGLLDAAFASTAMLAATEPLEDLMGYMVGTIDTMGWINDQLQATLDGKDADGILGTIGAAIADGTLDLGEGFTIMATLLSAGGESTTSLIGNALYLLATDPELQAQVRSDDSLLKPFIEEVLRLEAPFRYHMRHATRTTELAGVEIPEAATMLLLWGAANRDPAEYDRPDDIVLDRMAPRHHMGFGRGIHLCVGAPLARLEAEVVLSQLLKRTADLQLVEGDPPVRVNSLMVRRFERLPLQVTLT